MKNFVETKLNVEISLDCHDKTLNSEWSILVNSDYCDQENILIMLMDVFSDFLGHFPAVIDGKDNSDEK